MSIVFIGEALGGRDGGDGKSGLVLTSLGITSAVFLTWHKWSLPFNCIGKLVLFIRVYLTIDDGSDLRFRPGGNFIRFRAGTWFHSNNFSIHTLWDIEGCTSTSV